MKLLFAMTEGFLSAEATPVHPTALLTPFVVTSFKADASTNCHSPFFVFYSVERVGHQSPNHVRHFFTRFARIGIGARRSKPPAPK